MHHLGRKDPRHNFSVYFYHIYLTFTGGSPGGSPGASLGGSLDGSFGGVRALAAALDPGALAIVPQASLLLAAAAGLHAHLPLCWLAQTLVFVAFNTVSTAQYFVWYYCLLPLLLPHLPWPPPRRLVGAAAFWAAAQVTWLGWGYMLEFKGLGVYLPLWAASCVFLAAHTALLGALLATARPQRSFLSLSVQLAREGERAAAAKRA